MKKAAVIIQPRRPIMMSFTVFPTRAVLGAIGTAAVAGAVVLAAAPTALADPQPNCTAADLAQTATGVSAGMSVYLFSHPDVNEFLTGLEGSPRDTIRPRVEEYMNANPQVKAEMSAIRQPLVDMRARCGTGGVDDEA
jgi:hemophore-related protein